jgi:hypothetical protein
VLFISGGKDRRMPPGVPKRCTMPIRVHRNSSSSMGRTRQAFNTDRERYLEAVLDLWIRWKSELSPVPPNVKCPLAVVQCALYLFR